MTQAVAAPDRVLPSSPGQRLLCLALHAERLHDDPTWHRISRLLAQIERGGGRTTLFVSTLRAAAAGVDLRERLRELRERGHELGQHTHYYETAIAAGIVSFTKRTALSEENIGRCLALDHETLTAAGIRPRGFVSGGWVIHDSVFSWLVEHGFEYDCSFRSFPLGYHSPAAGAGKSGPEPFDRADGLLEIPTTATLSLAVHRRLRRGKASARLGDLRYDVVYLHDYDLIDFRRRAQVAALQLLPGDAAAVPMAELAARVRALLPRA